MSDIMFREVTNIEQLISFYSDDIKTKRNYMIPVKVIFV